MIGPDLTGTTIQGVRVLRLATPEERAASRYRERHWVCLFACGHVAVKPQRVLLRPNSVRWCSLRCRSRCRSAPALLVGDVVGLWRVEAGPHFASSQPAMMECRCVRRGHLRTIERYRLAGYRLPLCLQCRRIDLGLIDVLARYKGHAKAAGRCWTLTRDEAEVLLQSPCFYCAAPPSNTSRKRRPYPHNGLDRFDNARGYERDNVVPCCRACNLAKRDMSAADFIALARRIARQHPA